MGTQGTQLSTTAELFKYYFMRFINCVDFSLGVGNVQVVRVNIILYLWRINDSEFSSANRRKYTRGSLSVFGFKSYIHIEYINTLFILICCSIMRTIYIYIYISTYLLLKPLMFNFNKLPVCSIRRYPPNIWLKERRGKEEYLCIIVLFPVPEDEFRIESRTKYPLWISNVRFWAYRRISYSSISFTKTLCVLFFFSRIKLFRLVKILQLVHTV